jgi:uncharacterized protein (TIGR03435 family)
MNIRPVLILGFTFALTATGQDPNSNALRFEVASVRAAPEARGLSIPMAQPPGRFTAVAPVLPLIQSAYGLAHFQLIGGPGWIRSDFYAIDAKAEANSSREQIGLMLRALLAERFQLKARLETRELPVYVLEPAKAGLKIRENDRPCLPTPGDSNSRRGRTCGEVATSSSKDRIYLSGVSVSVRELTRTLGVLFGRTVIDRSGFNGKFDVKLEFGRDGAIAGLQSPGTSLHNDNSPSPSIFTALQDELGLRLYATKGPSEVLVIESVERPRPN